MRDLLGSSRTSRSRPVRPWFAGFVLLAACNLLGGPSRVKSGELFETGEASYDAYFKQVHDIQVAAVGWSDERKAACRPLVDELKLAPEAADVTIVQEAHERVLTATRDVGAIKLTVSADDVALTAAEPSKVDEPTRELFRALETCAHAQSVRAKTLRDVPPKVDELLKTGHGLEPHVRETFAKRGGRTAMDVQQELGASYEVLGDVSKQARGDARAAEDFVSDLQRAVDTSGRGASEPSEAHAGKAHAGNHGAAHAAAPKPEAKPSPKPAAKPSEAKPAAKPSEPKPESKPAPKPPKPKPPAAEDFNP